VDTSSTIQVDGLEVSVFTLTSSTCKAVVTNLGARLMELYVPDRDGNLADIVLQRPSLEDMSTDDNYMGSTAGRYANRIRNGKLTVAGRPLQLSVNEGSNHLHGGTRGFDRHLWSSAASADGEKVTFWRISPDGEEGYPGTLTTSVTYSLLRSTLLIEIRATTDATTVVNIVNHSYFNLAGHDSGSVLGHLLQMRSSFYTPVDESLLPTGEVLSVADTPFDFRAPKSIGQDIAKVEHSGAGRVTTSGAGYDHNWVLEGTGMREVLNITEPHSGRRLAMSTNQPGVQLYTGGYLEGVTGKPPVGRYSAFAGLTLETQTFPDAVNQSHFPPANLKPGETYTNIVQFDFSAS
jgi:aldose 1-epimerase